MNADVMNAGAMNAGAMNRRALNGAAASRRRLALVLLSSLVPWLSLVACAGAGVAVERSQEPPPAAVPKAGVGDIGLSPQIPYDVVITGSTLEAVQRDFDEFAWKLFVALDWPVDERRRVAPKTPIGGTPDGDHRTVWETWKEAGGIIRPGGAPPTPWGAPVELPPACREPQAEGGEDQASKLLSQASKVPLQLVSSFEQVFETGPLVDQNGVYARYEIVVDRPMFDYIVTNQLFSRAGQQAFTGSVEFPQGDHETETVGAIMVKAAWKVLGEGDDPSRFHVTEAWVYTPPSEQPPVVESCVRERLGLVGIHMVARTTTAPQWIWATFEQVDNAPDYPVTDPSAHYNFYDPASTAPINTVAPRPWDPSRPGPPTQVVRLEPLDAATRAINAEVQAKLAAINPRSVWQYYQLVNTQWPAAPHDPRNPLGRPTPPTLANTTIETYDQGVIVDGRVEPVPQGTSSCMSCHNNATLTTAVSANFTYLLSQAH